MAGLLGLLLIAYVLTGAVSDARIDHTYAKQGLVSPRLEAKYGAGARERTKRYGFVDFLADAWSDHWQRRAAALEADREAYLANPGRRVRLRDRLAAAQRVMATVGRKLVEPVPTRAEREPVEVAEPQPDPAPALAVDTGDVPAGTIQYTDAGRKQWTGSEWASAPKPSPRPRKVGERYTDEISGRVMEWRGDAWVPVCSRCDIPMTGHDDHGWLICQRCGMRAADDRPAATTSKTTSTSRGGIMTAPTGEAVNYETTVEELRKLAEAQQGHVDHCQAAVKAVADAKGAINNMQESYRASSAAASSMSEHLAAMNLDGVTLANAGTVADAMPAGVVDQWYDQLEGMEVQAQQRLTDAETALAATEANLAHVVATYGDAHATVAGNLGGDSSFLHSGGGAGVVAGGGTSNGEMVRTVPTHTLEALHDPWTVKYGPGADGNLAFLEELGKKKAERRG